MERRKYTREFKLETVNMMKGRGVSLARKRPVWPALFVFGGWD